MFPTTVMCVALRYLGPFAVASCIVYCCQCLHPK